MIPIIIFLLSIGLQLTAASFALLLIRTTGRKLAWILLSLAMVLMASRRIVSFVSLLSAGKKITFDIPELIALVISILMLAGVLRIGRYFSSIRSAEDKIREPEKEYRSLVDSALIGIYKTNFKGDILYVNEALSKMFEFNTSHEMIQEGVLSRYKDLKDREVVIENLKKNGKVTDFEVEVLTKTGKIKNILLSAVLDEDVISGMILDITERKKTEITLRKSNELLKIITRVQTQFISDTNPNTLFDTLLSDILSLTQSEYGFIGEVLYTDEGRPYLKTHVITNIAWDEKTREFYEENAPNGMEFHNLKTLFGAVITSEKPVISNNPSSDPRSGGIPEGHPPINAFLGIPFSKGGKLIGMIGIANRPGGYDEELLEYLQPILATCANIIEAYRIAVLCKQEEAMILQSKKEWEMTFDSVTELIAIVDKDFNIIRCNMSFTEFAEKPLEKIEGYKFYDLFPLGQKEIEYYTYMIKSEEPSGALEIRIKTGQWFYINERPILDKNGKFIHAVITATNITELKDAQLRLIDSEIELKNRVEELEKFYQMAIGRELRMRELKEENARLTAELSKYKKEVKIT